MISYKRARDGEWVVCGPVTEVVIGPITMTTSKGEVKKETILELGTPFPTENGEFVYGYLASGKRGNANQMPSSRAVEALEKMRAERDEARTQCLLYANDLATLLEKVKAGHALNDTLCKRLAKAAGKATETAVMEALLQARRES